jgi:hypothetical protein
MCTKKDFDIPDPLFVYTFLLAAGNEAKNFFHEYALQKPHDKGNF